MTVCEMNATVNQNTKTPEEIVQEANEIFSKVNKENYGIEDSAKADELLTRLRGEHPEFSQQFPLVLRFMAQAKRYHPKAMERYLKKYKEDMKKWKTRKDYLETQADYVIILYKTINTRYDERRVRMMREEVLKQLLDEEEKFTKMIEEAEKEAEQVEKERDKDRRQRLYERLLRMKVEQERKVAEG